MAKLYSYCPECNKAIYNGDVMYRVGKEFKCSKQCARKVDELTATEIAFHEYIAG